MAIERYVKRILWVAKCATCEFQTERTENPPRSIFCNDCEKWVPFVEQSYLGPDLEAR